jgi:hypothetical protein
MEQEVASKDKKRNLEMPVEHYIIQNHITPNPQRIQQGNPGKSKFIPDLQAIPSPLVKEWPSTQPSMCHGVQN